MLDTSSQTRDIRDLTNLQRSNRLTEREKDNDPV